MAGHFDEAGHRQVSDAVTQAEAHTSGEIVTVVADRSDGYFDVALCWASGIAFVALVVLALWPAPALAIYDTVTGSWNSEHSAGLIFAIAAALAITKFVGVMLLLGFIDRLRLFLVPGPIRTRRVHDRAVELFKVGADRRTSGRTGILVYLSMREHRAEIVADQAINEKVSPEVWGEAMAEMLAEISRGRLAEGLAAGVRNVGAILAEHFPRAEDDVNEIPDRLIEL